jgi:hypothetical protein
MGSNSQLDVQERKYKWFNKKYLFLFKLSGFRSKLIRFEIDKEKTQKKKIC